MHRDGAPAHAEPRLDPTTAMSTNALDARLLLAKVSAVVRAGGAEPRPAPGFGLGAAVLDEADAAWV
ncbi:MAG TPA: hypothetical protein VID05_01725, partial [Acidimicrobiales bacterium]